MSIEEKYVSKHFLLLCSESTPSFSPFAGVLALRLVQSAALGSVDQPSDTAFELKISKLNMWEPGRKEVVNTFRRVLDAHGTTVMIWKRYNFMLVI